MEVWSFPSMDLFALLGLGLMLGLKHATELDHVVAVSTIVSEHRNIWRSVLVGGLWGVGHTASLVVVGVLVLAFRIAIPSEIAKWLAFCCRADDYSAWRAGDRACVAEARERAHTSA
jgi:high-affinity nickel permease